jgi:hypothetical protein
VRAAEASAPFSPLEAPVLDLLFVGGILALVGLVALVGRAVEKL